jgi:hypothetical protein
VIAGAWPSDIQRCCVDLAVEGLRAYRSAYDFRIFHLDCPFARSGSFALS